MAQNDDLSLDWPPEDDAAARPPVRDWPDPTTDEPDQEELTDMVHEGIALATDGCEVEPDGVCPHGHPSWLLRLEIM